jgi:hypothetical protein
VPSPLPPPPRPLLLLPQQRHARHTRAAAAAAAAGDTSSAAPSRKNRSNESSSSGVSERFTIDDTAMLIEMQRPYVCITGKVYEMKERQHATRVPAEMEIVRPE